MQPLVMRVDKRHMWVLPQGCVFASYGTSLSFLVPNRSIWDELDTREGDLRQDLILRDQVDLKSVPQVPNSRALYQLEEKVLNAVCHLLPVGRRPQFVLGFAGRSKTDPLYALRFLDKACTITGAPGYLSVYDYDDHPLTRSYYEQLQGHHTLLPHWGFEAGAIEMIRPQLAHMAMALMPGCHYDLILHFFKCVLVKGGVGIWVHEYDVDNEIRQDLYDDMMEVVRRDFTLLAPVIEPAPFITPFSSQHPRTYALALQKLS